MSLTYKLYRFKYKFGKWLNLNYPIDVSLELASSCNMACSYCYHNDQGTLPFKKGMMDYETAVDIIEESAALEVPSIKFNWKGEATLNPNYTKIARLAKNFSWGSTFIDRLNNSNFKIHPRVRDDKFIGLACMTKVKVSYDSSIAHVFNTQRNKGDHELTTENIDLFYNHPERIKSETEIVLQAVRTKLNRNEDLEHNFKKRWPEITVSIRDMVEGRINKDLEDLTLKNREFSNRQSCLQAHVRLIFNWQGDAFPCCPDIGEKLWLGNIKDDTLHDIYNGVLAEKLRKDLKNKKAFRKDPCLNCPSFESYKGFKQGWKS